MEILLKHSSLSADFIEHIKYLGDICRISKLEKLFSDSFESMPNSSPIDYVGELNRADVMH